MMNINISPEFYLARCIRCNTVQVKSQTDKPNCLACGK